MSVFVSYVHACLYMSKIVVIFATAAQVSLYTYLLDKFTESTPYVSNKLANIVISV